MSVEFSDLARLAKWAGLRIKLASGMVIFARDEVILHETNDLDDAHGWLVAWCKHTKGV